MLMKIDGAVDYANHDIKVKQLLTDVYDLILDRNFVDAASKIDLAIVELRLMRNAVKTYIKE